MKTWFVYALSSLLIVAVQTGCPEEEPADPTDGVTAQDTGVEATPGDALSADVTAETGRSDDTGTAPETQPDAAADAHDDAAADAHDGAVDTAPTSDEGSTADHGLAELPADALTDATPMADAAATDATDSSTADDAASDAVAPMDVATGDVPPTCGPVTFQGCCAGTLLKFCELGVLVEVECSPDTCGWFPDFGDGLYACGEQGEDPSGNVPLDCPAP